jgi:hypothetical protein
MLALDTVYKKVDMYGQSQRRIRTCRGVSKLLFSHWRRQIVVFSLYAAYNMDMIGL